MTSLGTAVGRVAVRTCVLLLMVNIGVSRSYDLDDFSIDDLGHQEKDSRSVQAQLTSLQNQLGALLQRVISADHRFSALDHSVTALNHRVNSLDQRLSALQLEPTAEKKWSGHQSDQGRSGPSFRVDGEEEGEGGLPKAMAQSEGMPFRLRQVTKTDLGYVYRVSMLYQSSTVPDVLLKMDSYPVRVQTEEPGVATVYIPKEDNNITPRVYFVFPEYFFSVRLNLTSMTAMDLPLTTLKIAPGNDVTFFSGQDAQMEFTFYVDGDMQNIESERAAVQFSMKSDEKEHTVDRFHFFYFNSRYTASTSNLRLDLTNMKGSNSYRRGTMLINTSHTDAEGIIEAFVTLNFNCSINCLVKQMTKQHHVNLYRADHYGPFPQGFIGFVHDDYKRNVTLVPCDMGPHARPCAILCEAVGDRVMSVDIEKVGGSDMDAVRARHLTAGIGGFWGAALMAFDSLQVEDSGDYLCTARSETGEITQRMTLAVERRWDEV